MRKQKVPVFLFLLLLIIALLLQLCWANKALELNTYVLSSKNLPQNFSGFRIAQISDLHNTQIGDDNEKLLDLLREAAPDIIVITGDLVDSRNTDVAVALDFMCEAVKIAPCYYISGNHEARIAQYGVLTEGLHKLGVAVLENACVQLKRGSEAIRLLGMQDPSFQTDYLFGDSVSVISGTLEKLAVEGEGYTLLLSHRPELFDIYAQNCIDLTLSGHAHGGQFRLPFVGGLYAPNQGFFPQYDAGLYTSGGSQMVVSRGIGNSLFPIRLNNRPEIILIELHSEKY